MIKKCSLNDIANITKAKIGRRIADIEEFIRSGEDCCEVILDPNEVPKNVQSSFLNAARRREYYDGLVQVILRGNKVYLVRKENKRVRENNAE